MTTPQPQDHAFEKLGAFYLGKLYDLDEGKRLEDLLLYDSKDLVTHAVCVGMTGSGKTGLCVGVLEEASMDGIPAIAIDPKGDLGNLLLTFPGLSPQDFLPWINPDDAARKDRTPEAHAAAQAELWRNGLAEWGQGGDRIRRLREAVEMAIYTPGSTAGTPISILKSLAAPPPAIRDDAELLGDRITTSVTSLLGLLGIETDPIQSREHILVSTILRETWGSGRDLDLASLIQAIQNPPIDRVGVMDLDAFYPEKDRFALAMRLNNLLAAPGFEAWLSGAALDVDRLLWTADGKPRISIISIAHLNDEERMFFVSLLLNEIVGWMRSQPGTTSLRALVYMDEIFGFFPPVANPPSKTPLLTLLKQARAYGLGVMLATQNPVDLDYKGLSNTGTWFIGRLQTERDKARVLEGLEGVAVGTERGFDRSGMEETLAGLGKRVFLMNNVHESEPVTFETRWVMSYLRGPLTRHEIQRLASDTAAADRIDEHIAATAAPVARPTSAAVQEHRPVLPPEVPEYFVPARGVRPAQGSLAYEPVLLTAGQYMCVDKKSGVSEQVELVGATPVGDGPFAIDWDSFAPIDFDPSDLEEEPLDASSFEDVPDSAAEPKSYKQWGKEFADWIYRTQAMAVLHSTDLGVFSQPGESERDFRIRLRQAARERRDEMADKLQDRYAPRIARLEEKIRKAQQVVEREAEQARGEKVQTAISVGATLLTMVLGGKKGVSRTTLGRATTAMRGAGRSRRQAGDVARARENLAAAEQKLSQLDEEFQAELEALDDRIDPLTLELEEVAVRPLKKNIHVSLAALAWLPYWDTGTGERRPAWV